MMGPSKVSVHVLCPAIVNTNITKSDRNRGAIGAQRFQEERKANTSGFLDSDPRVVAAFQDAFLWMVVGG